MATKPPLLSILFQQLRQLQSCFDKDIPLSYSECVEDIYIAEKLLTLQKVEGHQRPKRDREYCLEVVRCILLTQLELLCVSTELENDVETSFSECKKVCELTEIWTRLSSPDGFTKTCRQQKSSLEFCDFSKRIIRSRSKLISRFILDCLSQPTLLHIAKFESVLIRALLGIFATFTSLLSSSSAEHTAEMIYVSDEMFALAQGRRKLSWKDCLIPGVCSCTYYECLYHLLPSLYS